MGAATLVIIRRKLAEAISLQNLDSSTVRKHISDLIQQQLDLIDAELMPVSNQHYTAAIRAALPLHPDGFHDVFMSSVLTPDPVGIDVCLDEIRQGRARVGVPHMLRYAIRQQHYSVMDQLLKNGFSPSLNERGLSELHYAILFDDVLAVKMLLHFYPQVSMLQTGYGQTPLCLALNEKRFDIVKALLHAGADIDQANLNDGNTPIHLAAETGQTEVLGYLLQAGGHPDRVTHDGKTPLLLAVEQNQEDTVVMLLDYSVDVNQSINGVTPLEVASYRMNQDMDESMFLLLVSYGASMDGSNILGQRR